MYKNNMRKVEDGCLWLTLGTDWSTTIGSIVLHVQFYECMPDTHMQTALCSDMNKILVDVKPVRHTEASYLCAT